MKGRTVLLNRIRFVVHVMYVCVREREKKMALVVERERDAVEGLVKRLQEKQHHSHARSVSQHQPYNWIEITSP